MPLLLAVDVGSSSVKAAVLREARAIGGVVRVPYSTDLTGDRAQVPADRIFATIASAIRRLDPSLVRRADALATTTLGPSWVAMDARGRAITPIVTHHDRRSIDQARRIERDVGRQRHLRIAGSRPVPGGISSTTAAWFCERAPATMRRARLVGHLTTLLLRQWCSAGSLGAAGVIDPSHASFMGLFNTFELPRLIWSDELCGAAGVPMALLPTILPAGQVAGTVSRSAGADFGLPECLPLLAGIIDGSVPLLEAGLVDGRMVNVVGSTDVLAACAGGRRPPHHEQLLTRALGVAGRWWAQVATLAASGLSLRWAHQTLYADLPPRRFATLVRKIAGQLEAWHNRDTGNGKSTVRFDPWLAGDRTSLEQPTAGFRGLRLGTGREEMLRAVIVGLAEAGAARVDLLHATRRGRPLERRVLVSGGMDDAVMRVMHRRWPGRGWRFEPMPDATVSGLWRLLEPPA